MDVLRDLFPAFRAALEPGLRDGQHPGGQLHVWHQDRVVADVAFGEDSPGHPLTPDHLMLWLSATKPVTAVALMQQVEAGRVSLDTPVADILPDFGAHGKRGITLHHVLTHTAGIRGADLGWKPQSWEAALENICAVRPEPRWEPGRKAGYHVDSLAYLQGEVVRRLTGEAFGDYVRRQVFGRLGVGHSFIGIPGEVYRDLEGRIARLWDTSGPHAVERAEYREPRVCALSRPGGNGRGPARELAALYVDLLSPEPRLLRRATVEAMTARVRDGMFDHTFRHVMDWGLGFALCSNRHGVETVPYNFGRRCSEATFGHCGNQCTAAFADPVHRVVVVLLLNGQPGEVPHQARMRELLSALYADLGL